MTYKITADLREAVLARRPFKSGQTELRVVDTELELRLHGHKIYWTKGTTHFFSLCGFNTRTTWNRLSACGIRRGYMGYSANMQRVVGWGVWRVNISPQATETHCFPPDNWGPQSTRD